MCNAQGRRPRRESAIGVLLAASLLTTGCCSIVHQTMQDVSIASEPSKARVIIDAQPRGETPLVAELKRKHNHTLRLELEGYQPHEMFLMRRVSGWVWGNIALGGLIGLAVDALDGSMYKLTPKQVQVTLDKAEARVLYEHGEIYVFIGLRADPDWERIGALTPDAVR